MSTYPTRDLYLSAYLHALGYTLVDIQRDADRRCTFTFEDRETRPGDTLAYYDRTATVNAAAFVDAIRLLKVRLHSA